MRELDDEEDTQNPVLGAGHGLSMYGTITARVVCKDRAWKESITDKGGYSLSLSQGSKCHGFSAITTGNMLLWMASHECPCESPSLNQVDHKVESNIKQDQKV